MGLAFEGNMELYTEFVNKKLETPNQMKKQKDKTTS
jgi:hypothetical protein